ncbi:MAG: NAD-dependent epimerase/dehydratase family protein [Myxococcales bacterium]|nr:MAG: NAD-dependent epimerase/dehydratase family protein [Myxococcales bacterium]
MSAFADSPSAFVAGATGYVGQAVVRELRARNAGVVAHVRSDSPQLEAWRERFAALGAETDATPWEREAMTRTLAALKPDAMFILIGTTRRRMQALGRAGGDPAAASYETIDYGLTALLVDAARVAGIRPRLVYLSAMGAGPTAKGAYMRARTRAEQTVRESGLPFVVARPGIITGPDREDKRPLELFAGRVIDAGLTALGALGLSSLKTRYASIDAATLARALVRPAFDPASENAVIEAEGLRG